MRSNRHRQKVARATPDLAYERTSSTSSSDSSLKTEWMNSDEAAIFLRMSAKALHNMTSSGQLPFYKLGRRNRYRKDELEAVLLSQKRGLHYGN